jgi:hypothetical protein
MFGIGDFARHGRSSVRVLRHHGAIGLSPAAGPEGRRHRWAIGTGSTGSARSKPNTRP